MKNRHDRILELELLRHEPKSFDWRASAAAPHPLKSLPDPLFEAACGVLNQIIALG